MMQTKVYSPDLHIVYVIWSSNNKGRKTLYSACGRISAIKEYCNKHKIDYTNCKVKDYGDVHYLEVEV